jgi:hypothetical protein
MGEACRPHDARLQRKVAIKIVALRAARSRLVIRFQLALFWSHNDKRVGLSLVPPQRRW